MLWHDRFYGIVSKDSKICSFFLFGRVFITTYIIAQELLGNMYDTRVFRIAFVSCSETVEQMLVSRGNALPDEHVGILLLIPF
jgi:hypothetical protein